LTTKHNRGGVYRAWARHWRSGRIILPKQAKALRFRNRTKDTKPKDDDEQMTLAV
jgi:hypothetical protein